MKLTERTQPLGKCPLPKIKHYYIDQASVPSPIAIDIAVVRNGEALCTTSISIGDGTEARSNYYSAACQAIMVSIIIRVANEYSSLGVRGGRGLYPSPF